MSYPITGNRIRVRVVATATRYRRDGQISNPGRARDFYFLQNVQNGSGGRRTSIEYAPGFFSGEVKRTERESNSSPSSIELENEWSCTYTSPICLQGLDMENVPLPLHWQFL